MEALAQVNNDSLEEQMMQVGRQARDGLQKLSTASSEQKNKALQRAAEAIRVNAEKIKTANAKDMEAAKDKGHPASFLDRLELNDERIESMAKGIEAISELDDPVGKELARWDRPNGLDIARVSVPLGVIGIIYESRPNVTADAGALSLKAGNAAILRGGSESFHSSRAILECLQEGLREANLPEYAVQLVPTSDREAVSIMLGMAEYIDIIVPRGGRGLIEKVIAESKIPTIQHLDGNCHSYIHHDADPQKAIDVVVNAKMRRTGICGATESIVIDESIADSLLPKLVSALQEKGCEVRGDKTAQEIDSNIKPANDDDWDTEYLDSVVSVKIVGSLHEGIEWVNNHSSHHTDAIITENDEAAEKYLREVDSAIVMRNASTQFADGGEFGMGAEIGISTGRLHARGPVGVEQLTTFKYLVRGDGQTRP